jgi:predicted nucleic acid-binding protein
MSGTKFVLDTNYILGLLKSDPAVLAEVSERKVKLPDAIIVATALCAGLQLPTLDKHLQSVAQKV